MIQDYEARLRSLAETEQGGGGGGGGGGGDRAAVLFDLLGEYIAHTCSELAFSPTVSINLLPHTHLVNYGGAYYSYLFAKMHASQIWQNQFADDPLSRYIDIIPRPCCVFACHVNRNRFFIILLQDFHGIVDNNSVCCALLCCVVL
jgi:hypothetical protein